MSETQADLSRRRFLKIGFALGTGLILGKGLGACTPQETLEPDEFAENLNPHFKAYNPERGGLVEARGTAAAVAESEGKIVFELFNKNGQKLYLDPLALQSAYYGEHPAEKTLRIAKQAKLDIPYPLEKKLENLEVRDSLCNQVTFELPYGGEKATMVVSEILADGSATVIIKDCPQKYQPPNSEYLSPKFFSITSNRFDKQVLRDAGFIFDSSVYGNSIVLRAEGLLKARLSLSLYSSYFRASMLKKIGIPLKPADLMAHQIAKIGNETYFSTMDSYPASSFGRLYKLDAKGQLLRVHEAPGRFLFAMFNPIDTSKLLLSGEGYKENDFRFQSLFEKDLKTGKETMIEFPGSSRSGRPELYASGGMYDSDGNTILNRYGFHDEGGGLWWLNAENYEDKKYLTPWDHMIGYNMLDSSSGRLIITAKEVEDNFSMTVNEAVIRGRGTDTSITEVRRIAKLVGWNPQIAGFQKLGGGKFRVQVQTPYNFEGYVSNMPQAIYDVDLI